MPTEWTVENGEAARSEGWDIFDSQGSENGPWQIQRLDDVSAWDDAGPTQLSCDIAAWRLVVARADEGSVLHQRALAFIAERNPLEYEAIKRNVGVPRSPCDDCTDGIKHEHDREVS